MEAVVRRKLITAPGEAARWIGLVWRVRLAVGVFLNLALLAWLAVFRDEMGATGLIMILALGLLQPAGMTADMWMQANLQARRATMASWMALIAGALGRLYLVRAEADLTAFAWVALAWVYHCRL